RTSTSVIVSFCFFGIHEWIFSSFGGIHTKIRNRLGNKRKQPSWHFVTGSSEDFVIWIIDVSSGLIQFYMCERSESLLMLWLLNKTSKLFLFLPNRKKKCKKDQHKILFYSHVCNI
ncbi:hypothetical protein LSH36_91g07006, partial [Paralvinella palmiformis]